MDILVRQVLIIDPSSPFHQQKVDILIQNGMIAEIGSITKTTDREIVMEGLHASPGWVDVFANFCDPGFEFKETLESGASAAASGGFTDVLIIPNTSPVIYNKGGIEYIIQRSKSLPVSIHPIGAISRNAEGKELAEMYDMHASGAIAFSDGLNPVQSSGMLLKALQYVKSIGKTIIQLPDDKNLSGSGLMNEGIISTQLGLAGQPALAEELIISRDLELVQYTDSKIHFTGISTERSVELIKNAKQKGISVTCSVTPYHLFFSDEDLATYDTHLKVNPPLRTRQDQKALINGLLEGVIDCMASHHLPENKDAKVVEFEYAKNGMIGLETSFAAISTAIPQLPLEKIVQLFSTNASKIFGLSHPVLDKGKVASITLFSPQEVWTPDRFYSKSSNSPFTGKQLKGKPLGIINKDQLFLNQ